MNLNLTNKNVVITGGAGILGQEFCQAFANEGANVAILEKDEESAAMLKNKISSSSDVKVKHYICDLTSESSVNSAIEQVTLEFKKIDFLVNNAASKSSSLKNFFTPFEEFSINTWREVMSVNIDGMFLVAKAVGKHMREQKIKGSIIQISSIYGSLGPDQRIYEGSEYMGMKINTPAVYSASKGAVISLTKYLAAYWGNVGIRVNTLTPGGIYSGQNDVFIDNYSKRVPLGRMGEKNELIGALLYLSSDASSYVTGQNLMVDGGLSCW
jgi:NAD(P)-dependent dehydrogenase (short-subunit alcohol dehydrogenase family)